MTSKLAQIKSEASIHHFVGNALCLDFANTLYGHSGNPVHEYLYNYRDLVIWSHKAKILEESVAEKLIRLGDQHANEALAVFHHAIALRETIYRVFTVLTKGDAPNSADLATLNDVRKQGLVHSHIDRTPHGFVIDWDNKTALGRMLWPISISAGDILTDKDVSRIRQCSGCDWLFLDTSRNHMRRWCSMNACGNRAKVRRFHERRKKQTR